MDGYQPFQSFVFQWQSAVPSQTSRMFAIADMDTTSKALLRKQYMALRRALAPEATEALNSGLLRQVRAIDWSKLSALHTFLPIASQNEPDTFRIIAWLRDEHPGVRIVVPRVADGAGGTLVHHLLDERTVLVKNQWGIPEPTGGERVEPRSLDAVLVPLLAFDLSGNRVGYGQGFYDRFLSACQPG